MRYNISFTVCKIEQLKANKGEEKTGLYKMHEPFKIAREVRSIKFDTKREIEEYSKNEVYCIYLRDYSGQVTRIGLDMLYEMCSSGVNIAGCKIGNSNKYDFSVEAVCKPVVMLIHEECGDGLTLVLTDKCMRQRLFIVNGVKDVHVHGLLIEYNDKFIETKNTQIEFDKLEKRVYMCSHLSNGHVYETLIPSGHYAYSTYMNGEPDSIPMYRLIMKALKNSDNYNMTIAL